MSDQHIWFPKDTVDLVLGDLVAFRESVRDLTEQHRGEEHEPTRTALRRVVFGLNELETQMRSRLGQPGPESATPPAVAPGAHRAVGEGTRAWMAGQAPQMIRNQRPWNAR